MIIAAFVVLACAAACFFVRLLIGPSLSDRVVAIDGLLVVGVERDRRGGSAHRRRDVPPRSTGGDARGLPQHRGRGALHRGARLVIGEAVILLGCVLTLLAGIGVLRFGDVFERMHALTKASAPGLILVIVGAALLLPSINDVTTLALAAFLQVLTLPVAANLIASATYRAKDVPTADRHRRRASRRRATVPSTPATALRSDRGVGSVESDGAGDLFEVPGRSPAGQLVRLGPAGEQLQVVLHGEPHRAVHLVRAGEDAGEHVPRVRVGERDRARRAGGIGGVAVEPPRGLVRRARAWRRSPRACRRTGARRPGSRRWDDRTARGSWRGRRRGGVRRRRARPRTRCRPPTGAPTRARAVAPTHSLAHHVVGPDRDLGEGHRRVRRRCERVVQPALDAGRVGRDRDERELAVERPRSRRTRRRRIRRARRPWCPTPSSRRLRSRPSTRGTLRSWPPPGSSSASAATASPAVNGAEPAGPERVRSLPQHRQGRRVRRQQRQRGRAAPELLGEDGQLERAVPGAAVLLGQRDARPAELAHLGPELGGEAFGAVFRVAGGLGGVAAFEQLPGRLREQALVVVEGEVHVRRSAGGRAHVGR